MSIFMLIAPLTVIGESSESYCPFFDNRAPTPQPKLRNCTWYRSLSCCQNIEIEQEFAKVKTMPGSSPDCIRYFNYLMCYICSPEQYKFLGQKLKVCHEFCTDLYTHCKEAVLKGQQLHHKFDNGISFCEKLGYIISNDSTTLEERDCFYLKPDHLQYPHSSKSQSALNFQTNDVLKFYSSKSIILVCFVLMSGFYEYLF